MEKYCEAKGHEFVRVLTNEDVIKYQCKNCRCSRIGYAASKRFQDNVRDLGRETAVKVAGF